MARVLPLTPSPHAWQSLPISHSTEPGLRVLSWWLCPRRPLSWSELAFKLKPASCLWSAQFSSLFLEAGRGE